MTASILLSCRGVGLVAGDLMTWIVTSIIAMLPVEYSGLPEGFDPNAFTREQVSTDAAQLLTLWSVVPLTLLLVLLRMITRPVLRRVAFFFGSDEASGNHFAECIWKAFFDGLTYIIVSHLAAERHLWPETVNCYPMRTDTKASIEMQCLYLYQLSWYAQLTVCHFFLEVQRRDWWAVLCHHVAAVSVMSSSFMGDNLESGIIVFLTHQPTMTILEFGKGMHYLKRAWIEYALFPGFIVTWVLLKLYYFPKILYSSVYEIAELEVEPYMYKPGLAMLFILQFLYCVWTHMIVLSVWRGRNGKGIGDVREVEHTGHGPSPKQREHLKKD